MPEQHNARRHSPACQWKGVSLIGNYVNVAHGESSERLTAPSESLVGQSVTFVTSSTLPVCLPSTELIILTCALLTCRPLLSGK